MQSGDTKIKHKIGYWGFRGYGGNGGYAQYPLNPPFPHLTIFGYISPLSDYKNQRLSFPIFEGIDPVVKCGAI